MATSKARTLSQFPNTIIPMTAIAGGLVPTPPNDATKFLNGAGIWAVPVAGGTGTVTSASVVSANGLAGTVANPTTTPAITLTTSVTGVLKGAGSALVPAVNSDLPAMSATVGGAVPTPPNNTTNFLRADGTWAVPAGGGGTNVVGFRNRLINGDMRIDQRNLGVATTPTAPSYNLDRWAVSINAASKLTIQQVVDAPAGFKFSTKILVASQYAPIATDLLQFHQTVEGQNVIDFNLGTASAANLVVSFWAKASVAGTYSVAINNYAVTRSYVSTVSLTTSWAQYSVALTGDTTGTWLTDNSCSLYLIFNLGAGTNYNTTANAWQAGRFVTTSGSIQLVNQTAGATLNITGVQLELGTSATTFEQRPIGVELSLCKRYYQILTDNANYFAPFNSPAATNYVLTLPLSVFAVPMRVVPTLTSTWGTLSNVTGNPVVNLDAYSWSVYSSSTTSGYGFVYLGTQKASAEL